MPNPRLASRYAKSLLDIAVEQNAVDAALQDIKMMNEVCDSSRDFTNLLRSPVIKPDKKQSILDAIFGDKLHPLVQAFVKLLVNKGREENLPEIAEAFISQYKEMKNIKTVMLTTATAVSAEVKDAIIKKITGSLNASSIEVVERVDADIIGGFILQMDDKLIDASVRRDLNDIKAQFQQNIYVSPIFN